MLNGAIELDAYGHMVNPAIRILKITQKYATPFIFHNFGNLSLLDRNSILWSIVDRLTL